MSMALKAENKAKIVSEIIILQIVQRTKIFVAISKTLN